MSALERATGHAIAALAVVELGSLALAATFIAADLLGKAVLDCDRTGRSIPELGLSKHDLVGIPPAPAALVDRFGGETVVLASAIAAMTDRNRGRKARIWVKNENRVVWCDGTPVATSPDPIAVLDAATLEPLMTLGDVGAGTDVFVVIVPALDAIRETPAGHARLGPRQFGFDFAAISA